MDRLESKFLKHIFETEKPSSEKRHRFGAVDCDCNDSSWWSAEIINSFIDLTEKDSKFIKGRDDWFASGLDDMAKIQFQIFLTSYLDVVTILWVLLCAFSKNILQ